MGQSILRDREAPFQRARLIIRATYRKGIRLRFRNRDAWVLGGDANELGDVGEGPGKSSLFSLTALSRPWNIGLSGDRVRGSVELGTFAGSGASSTALENPRELE